MYQSAKLTHHGVVLAAAALALFAAGGCRNAPPATKAQSDATAQRNAIAASELQRVENDPNATQADKERAIAQLQKTQ